MKKNKYILFIILATCFNSCSNDEFFKLDRKPQNPWNTVEQLEYAAVSPYNKMFYGGYGTPQVLNLTNQVMQSDYFRFLGNVEGYATDQIYKRKYTDRISYIETLYGSLYQVIGLCNTGLELYRTTDNNPFPQCTADDKTKNVDRIRGELLFMRAYAYYQLAITFCPAYIYGGANDSRILVKRERVSLNSEDALNNAPATTGEIYDMMVADLVLAKSLLPKGWEEGMHESYKNRARANKWAASAFLAQVYFTMGKFTNTESADPNNALSELNDVIGNGGYTLAANPFDCFNNQSTNILASDIGSKEVILWGFYADSKTFTNIHNSLYIPLFTKCARDSKGGGNGQFSAGTWSNFPHWLQMTLSKNALEKMGWMTGAGAETNAAKLDLRYYNMPPDITQVGNYKNKFGLFYRYEGAYTDSLLYMNAFNPKKTYYGLRPGASDDGRYIISPEHGGLIGKTEPVILVNKYFRTDEGRFQNIPMIRLAELYLNRAMIKRRAGIAGWSDDYNKVAQRAWNSDGYKIAAAVVPVTNPLTYTITTIIPGTPYAPKSDAQIDEEMILIERWKELAGEDSWYLPFCKALGYTIGQGDRTAEQAVPDLVAPYADAYWKNCIPLTELDFQKK